MGRTGSSIRSGGSKLFKAFLNFILAISVYLLIFVDIFIMRSISLINLRLHGRFPGRWLTIKEATSTMLNMEYVLWEAMTHLSSGTLHTSMELAFKIICRLLTWLEYYQVGLACVTPNRIPGLWEKSAMKQVTLEQVKEEVVSDGDDGDSDHDRDEQYMLD